MLIALFALAAPLPAPKPPPPPVVAGGVYHIRWGGRDYEAVFHPGGRYECRPTGGVVRFLGEWAVEGGTLRVCESARQTVEDGPWPPATGWAWRWHYTPRTGASEVNGSKTEIRLERLR
jgi:hypothetical protein